MAHKVECPYCEHENDVSDYLCDMIDDKFDCECQSCEKEFEVEVEYDPSFTASEIVYEKCQSCGEETRNPYKRGRVYPYPKRIKHDVVCVACWKQAYREELEGGEADVERLDTHQKDMKTPLNDLY